MPLNPKDARFPPRLTRAPDLALMARTGREIRGGVQFREVQPAWDAIKVLFSDDEQKAISDRIQAAQRRERAWGWKPKLKKFLRITEANKSPGFRLIRY